MKKARQPALYTLSSLASWVVDTGLFRLFLGLFGGVLGDLAPTVCNVAARAFSSFFNFNLNNRVVFRSREPYGKALLRYYLLAIPQLAASTLLLDLFVWLFRIEGDNLTTLVKILVDGGLFVASFFIQKYWVFRNKEDDETAEHSETDENK